MARQLHHQAQDALEVAARYRDQRDDLVRRLRAEDPQRWSYSALAKAVGCSPELIAVILKPRKKG
ncbi:MAG: hypothetical protein HZY73_01005 [Micropruina sp.]|nr:MAG: hypothetical protein HZY73_01005 [Micropruina sp.]